MERRYIFNQNLTEKPMSDDVIGVGAEATVRRTAYLGRDAVVKTRVRKGYRHPELDSHLRSARTRTEVRVIREARAAGVRSPVIYDVDLSEGSITMEYIRGESVKSVLEEHPERADEICASIGSMIARLHNAGISHGDLTTSNMILDERGELCVIDFSLGDTRVDLEAMGVDIHLMERAFTSAHSDIGGAFAKAIEAYRKDMPDADRVLERVDDIKSRARYT